MAQTRSQAIAPAAAPVGGGSRPADATVAGGSGPVDDSCAEALAGLGAEELAAWRGMLRVHAALVKALDAELISAHELPLSSYEVLIALGTAPDRRRRMAELADSVLLSRSGMTRLVDRLERDGLLVREECPDDRRGSFAVLTDRGAELLARARPTHLDGVRERFLRHFSAAELRLLADYWERVLPEVAQSQDLSRQD